MLNLMTIKEIAALCEVEERTIQRWAKEAGGKMSSIGDKMSASSPTYPAAFTLPEVLTIIRAGGKNTLADLLAENASGGRSECAAVADRLDRLEHGIMELTKAVAQLIPAVAMVKARPARAALPAPSSPLSKLTSDQAKAAFKSIQWWPISVRKFSAYFSYPDRAVLRLAGALGLNIIQSGVTQEAARAILQADFNRTAS